MRRSRPRLARARRSQSTSSSKAGRCYRGLFALRVWPRAVVYVASAADRPSARLRVGRTLATRHIRKGRWHLRWGIVTALSSGWTWVRRNITSVTTDTRHIGWRRRRQISVWWRRSSGRRRRRHWRRLTITTARDTNRRLAELAAWRQRRSGRLRATTATHVRRVTGLASQIARRCAKRLRGPQRSGHQTPQIEEVSNLNGGAMSGLAMSLPPSDSRGKTAGFATEALYSASM